MTYVVKTQYPSKTPNTSTLEIKTLQGIQTKESFAFNSFCTSVPSGTKPFLSGQDITSELQVVVLEYGVVSQTKKLDSRCSYIIHNCKSPQVVEFQNTQEVKPIKQLHVPDSTAYNYQEILQLYALAQNSLNKEGYVCTTDDFDPDVSIADTLEQTFYDNKHPFVDSSRAKIAAESGLYAPKKIDSKALDRVYCISGKHPSIIKFEETDIPSEEHKMLSRNNCEVANKGLKPNGIDTKIKVVDIENNNESGDAFNIRRVVTNVDCQHLYLVTQDESIDGVTIALEALRKHVDIRDIVEYLLKNDNKLIANYFRPQCQEYFLTHAKSDFSYNLINIVKTENKSLCKEAVKLLQQAKEHDIDFPNIKVLSNLLSEYSIIDQISKLSHLVFRESLIEKFGVDISPTGEVIRVDKDIEIPKKEVVAEKERLLSEELAKTYDGKTISLKTITDTSRYNDNSLTAKGILVNSLLYTAEDEYKYESNNATREYFDNIFSMLSSTLPALDKLTNNICNILDGVHIANSHYALLPSPLYRKLEESLQKDTKDFQIDSIQSGKKDLTEFLLENKQQLQSVFNANYTLNQKIDPFQVYMIMKVSHFNISAEGNITFHIQSETTTDIEISREPKQPFDRPLNWHDQRGVQLIEDNHFTDSPLHTLHSNAELDIDYLNFSSSEDEILNKISIGITGKLIEHFLASKLLVSTDLRSFDIFTGKIVRSDGKIIRIEEYLDKDSLTLNAKQLLNAITLPHPRVDIAGIFNFTTPVDDGLLLESFVNAIQIKGVLNSVS